MMLFIMMQKRNYLVVYEVISPNTYAVLMLY